MSVEKKETGFSKIESLLLGLGFAVIVLVLCLYFGVFNGAFSESSEQWDHFGDFFGGVLNPLIAFLALVAIVFTLKHSREVLKVSKVELRETRNEMSIKRKSDEIILISRELERILDIKVRFNNQEKNIHYVIASGSMKLISGTIDINIFSQYLFNLVGNLGFYYYAIFEHEKVLGKEDLFINTWLVKNVPILAQVISFVDSDENKIYLESFDSTTMFELKMIQERIKSREND